MKYVRLFLLVIVSIAPSMTYAQSLIMTEIMYDVSGSDERREWCEVYNYGTEEVEIVTGSGNSSWRFIDTSSHLLQLTQGSARIAPGNFAIIASDAATWLSEHAFSGTVFDTVMSLNNASGTVALSIGSGETPFTQTEYQSSSGASGNGFSLERDSLDLMSGWHESLVPSGTPGFWQEYTSIHETTTATSSPDTGTATTTPEVSTTRETPPASQSVVIIVQEKPRDRVVINEILPNPTGDDTENEWIELFNTGDAPVDVHGWSMQDSSARIFTLSEDMLSHTVIAPHGFILIPRSASAIALNNTGGDSVTLYYPDGSVADTVRYYDTAHEGRVWARFETGFEWSMEPTPGSNNVRARTVASVASADTASGVTEDKEIISFIAPPEKSLRISEVVPNPLGADAEEWIEIANVSSSTIDLSGWKLDDAEGGSKPYVLPHDTVIASGSFILFTKEVTKLQLGNAADTVRLIAPDGVVWQSIEYTKAPEGEAYAYDAVDDDWVWTDAPTPGTAFRQAQEESVDVLGVSTTTDTGVEVREGMILRGIVVVPPRTLSTRRFFVQPDDEFSSVEVYQSRGDMPIFAFGDRVEIRGTWTPDEAQFTLSSADEADSIGKGSIRFTDVELADISTLDTGNLVRVAGNIERVSKKSLRISDGDASVLVRLMDRGKTITRDLPKGARITVTGFVKQQSGGASLYIASEDALALVPESVESEQGVSSVRATSTQFVEGIVPEETMSHWYIVAGALIAVCGIYLIKKYIAPRLS